MLKIIGGFMAPLGEGASVADITTQVGTWLTATLGWLSSLFTWVIGEPLIIFFIAIGLCGAMIRWGRKLVHF